MTPAEYLDRCHFGDVRAVLRRMIADGVRVNTIVTSPPYWGLRSYLPEGHPDKAREIGSEPTLREFIATLTEVFDLCRQTLADDGTAWINMGDSYLPGKQMAGQPWCLAFALQDAGWYLRQDIIWEKPNPMPESVRDRCTKAHEYIFLLSKSERYYFDQEAIKEPVNGGAHPRRPGNAVPSKGQQAYEDGDARQRTKTGLLAYAQKVARPAGWASDGRHESMDWMTGQGVGRRVGPPGNPAERPITDLGNGKKRTATGNDSAYGDGKSERMGRGPGWRRKLAEAGSGTKNNGSFDTAMAVMPAMRNRRSVWTVASEPFSGAHFATFPTKLIEPCILAGAPAGGVVLDPFFGSGTTGQVAQTLGRHFIGIELNRDYEALQAERLQQPSLMLEVA